MPARGLVEVLENWGDTISTFYSWVSCIRPAYSSDSGAADIETLTPDVGLITSTRKCTSMLHPGPTAQNTFSFGSLSFSFPSLVSTSKAPVVKWIVPTSMKPRISSSSEYFCVNWFLHVEQIFRSPVHPLQIVHTLASKFWWSSGPCFQISTGLPNALTTSYIIVPLLISSTHDTPYTCLASSGWRMHSSFWLPDMLIGPTSVAIEGRLRLVGVRESWHVFLQLRHQWYIQFLLHSRYVWIRSATRIMQTSWCLVTHLDLRKYRAFRGMSIKSTLAALDFQLPRVIN